MQGTDKLNTITNIVICPHGRFRNQPSRNAAAI